ncbi:hypothetical protein EDB81DRAFT_797587 [Dactylonectria macrodidyma]|uniref:Zn(2)-C6 fungal-type domain-containing protein n=1 Tax=Dactylonectria macrodidyma TaxID=307937 RepID=A0A9P9J3C6_9HYPO|nr:hypothetical protein EDB81DRAFT_797587 [Dactylonectria macrodidyma]
MHMDRVRHRQGHRKSRNGCAVCKRRHIKCDERRPKCGNCDISERECIYAAPEKAKPTTSPYEQELTTSAWLRTASTSRAAQSPASPDLHNVTSNELFTLDHLTLLCHVQENMKDWMMVTDQIKPLADIYISSALKTPYLMNQLLALSAMHYRTIKTEQMDWYTQTATQLRSRALRGFSDSLNDTSNANATPHFLLSSLFALHYLAETIADARDQDFPTTLNHILEYFRLHRGARILGERAWPSLSSVLKELLAAAVGCAPEGQHTSEGACALISTMLRTSELNKDSLEACEEANQALGFVLQQLQRLSVHALMAWPNMIPPHFLTLLERQIPEALVILSHYAVLLYNYRTFWCLGNVGKRLVDGIAGLLAAYWATWLPTLDSEQCINPELVETQMEL